MTSIQHWQIAEPDHLISIAEHVLTQQPERFSVTSFALQNRPPLSNRFEWLVEAGRIVAFANEHFSYFCPFWQPVNTKARAPYAGDDNDFALNEAISLRGQTTQNPTPFYFTNEGSDFYFYDTRNNVRSRAIPEADLITSLCGTPQPHLAIASCHFVGITNEGIPHLGVALKLKGESSDFIHKPVARLIGLDDRDLLVAVGEIGPSGLLDHNIRLQVPAKQTITARRIDVAVHAFFGLACAVVLATTSTTHQGGRSIIALIGTAAGLCKAYSRYQRP